MGPLKIGLVANPIAGVGAALAWKGTDDVKAAWKAVDSGIEQPVWKILKRAIKSIRNDLDIKWILGGKYQFSPEGEIVYDLPINSTAIDTQRAVKSILSQDIDLLLFVGGDGTALDIAKKVEKIPILGIPGGVKIFSPCFLHQPEDLGNVLANWDGSTRAVDLLDLDEEAYRRGEARAKLVGAIIIPDTQQVQSGKSSLGGFDEESYRLIAERITEENWLNKTIAAGPGSTMNKIFQALAISKSLLGVDIINNGIVQAIDCTTEQLEQFDIHEIWLSPIGNQGHIFGRGNRQISSTIIRSVKKKHIRLFSTPAKMQNTPKLYVDTGDPLLDKDLRGYYSVVVGYYEEILRKVI